MIETDVVIIGGGASGLTASLLLSQLGIDTQLFSRHPRTSTLPKAHLISIKSMEIFRELGLEPAIRAMSAPPENMRYVGWYAGLGGPTPDHGREIARLGAWGRGHTDLDWRRASDCGYANLQQALLEPLMYARAQEAAPGRVRFNHSYISGDHDAKGVTATIEDRETGKTFEVRARYLLACDGGRAVGPELGIAMEGDLAVATNITIHFSADLSALAHDSEVFIRMIFNPDYPRVCTLIPVGPNHWGPDSEEWVLHLMSLPGDHKQYSREETIAVMQQVLGLPNFEPHIHMISRWPLDGVVASRFRVGNAFMLGDAAHRMPPAGGHGMNTAIQDSYNICWKLAAVINGAAPDALLDTYEAERRPVALRTVASAFFNWQNGKKFAASFDFGPHRQPEQIWSDLRLMWDGEGGSADELRRRVQSSLTTNLTNYNHININYGYTYDEGALVPDGTSAPEPIDPIQVYTPSTRPGASLPHAMLENRHGPTPIGDLLGRGRFVLITDQAGGAWRPAAAIVSRETGIPFDVFDINYDNGDFLDMRREWLRVREVKSGGAILVRPDRFIAARAMCLSDSPLAELRKMVARTYQVQPALEALLA